MALGVKAGVAAAVSYHSLTAAPIYQNLIVRTRAALPVTDRLAALESRWTALPNRARRQVTSEAADEATRTRTLCRIAGVSI
jgi:hypothetical protein